MKQPIIRLESVYKEFGKGFGKTQVLKGIDLSIYPGEFVIIFGPSGCGKSTLLNCIAGLETLERGSVVVGNTETSSLNEDKRAIFRQGKFGIIYQQPNWIKPLNVIENVTLPLHIKGFRYFNAFNRAKKALELFSLEKFSKNIPTELSGGQQQKVAMVRALVTNPQIILADEPTGNLDKVSADDLMYIFKSLNEEFKRTIILVTHNPEYEKFATKIIKIEDGGIKSVKEIKKVSLAGKEDIKDIIF